jgi:hypothetical protein
MWLLALEGCTPPIWDKLDSGSESGTTETGPSIIEDEDGDGDLSTGMGGTDCDDLDAQVYGGAPEVFDAVDNDCDQTDENVADFSGATTLTVDVFASLFGAIIASAPDASGDFLIGIASPLGGPTALMTADAFAATTTVDESARLTMEGGANDGLGIVNAFEDFSGVGELSWLLGAPFAGSLDGAIYIVSNEAIRAGGPVTADSTGVTSLRADDSLGSAYLGLAVARTDGWLATTVQLIQTEVLLTEVSSLGSSTVTVDETVTLEGVTGERFGGSLAGGDVTGDGLRDLIVGAPYATPTEALAGRVYVFDGAVMNALAGSTDQADASSTLAGDQAQERLGGFVAVGADATGDGLPDLLVASSSDADERTLLLVPGGEYLASATASLEDVRFVRVEEIEHYPSYTLPSAALVHLSGAAAADLVVGQPAADPPSIHVFTADQLVAGATMVPEEAALTAVGVDGSALGSAMAASDGDGDGREDLVVGAPGEGQGTVYFLPSAF